MAHVVYLEGNSAEARCFGIVQFFGGAFQFYVPLSSSYLGRDFGSLGILDIKTFHQQFSEIEPLRLPEAPRFVGQGDVERFFAEWGPGFNAQVQAAFDQGSTLFFASPQQNVAGIRMSLPLIWVEYEIEFQLMMDLVPDMEPAIDLTLPTDPRQWKFSIDYGNTLLSIFDTFVHRWNGRSLDRSVDGEQLYIPEEVTSSTRLLMGEAFWCPVQSIRLAYRVRQKAWLGSLELPYLSGTIDQSDHTMRTSLKITQENIPAVRDPSWPVLADPDGYEAMAENLVVVELWDIDSDSFRFGPLGFELDAC